MRFCLSLLFSHSCPKAFTVYVVTTIVVIRIICKSSWEKYKWSHVNFSRVFGKSGHYKSGAIIFHLNAIATKMPQTVKSVVHMHTHSHIQKDIAIENKNIVR